MRKINAISFSVLLCIYISILLVLLVVGNIANVNAVSMLVYISFLLIIFVRDVSFIAEFSWSIVLFSLNILGVYVCEATSMYLNEQGLYTSYCNALTHLIFCYVIFFGIIELRRLQSHQQYSIKIDKSYTVYNSSHINFNTRLITLVGTVLCAVLFLKVIKKPAFMLGLTRLWYMQEVLSGWQNSLKSYLPLFIPAAVNCGKTGNRKLMICFFSLLFLYYFWVGDKFGTFYFAIYVFLLTYFIEYKTKTLRKASIAMVIAVFVLLVVVYVQRKLTLGNGIDLFIKYLFNRLSNQGGTWYGVFRRYCDQKIMISEFSEELLSILPGSSIDKFSVGQWKMMLVSSGGSSYAQYRIETMNPYTATTTASLYYYFGYPATVLFYIVTGIMYGKFVGYTRDICGNGVLLESIVSIKVLIHLHAFLTSSDLYIISYKGLIYVAILCILICLRKNNMRIKIGKFYLT